ncbi:translocator protein-like [Paramacrobiotus metropolitanus]|uniref:translocator protein-like n=1 Tax=Paramacrobiotus metropolitanus TaxID=2943436 RepID=UPI00244643B3|nr:translocator protein-like [Paramacrobiotus metropolitanus]
MGSQMSTLRPLVPVGGDTLSQAQMQHLYPLPQITTSIFARELIPAMVIPNVGGWIWGYLLSREFEGPSTWYERLRKPSWTPPNWVFGPVWTVLYGGMGAASWLVWRQGGGSTGTARIPLVLYATQLALNWAWSPVFFKYHRLGLAFATISALWINVAACIGSFYPISETAAYLMVPYLGWLTLAAAGNFRFWRDNPGADGL